MSESNERRPKPVIFGCSGTRLTSAERTTFRAADPFGFILFKRNIESPEQIRSLILELKQATDRENIQIAIDQEGGRVARLQPPKWAKYPAARAFGHMFERDPEWGLEAIKLYARVLSHVLVRLGFTINCAPVIDLYFQNSPAIGDRAFSASPSIVAALARAQAETFLSNGILPVIKHLPGHGRMQLDPHNVLPTIDTPLAELETHDFVPFELLKDIPLGMNSHAIFTVLDPIRPASLSLKVNIDIIRGKLGFDGLLLSDDLAMKAVSGLPGELALRTIEAGNDIVLHCNGNGSEMEAISRSLAPMSDASWARWTHAKSMVTAPNPAYDSAEDAERLDVLLGGLAYDEVG